MSALLEWLLIGCVIVSILAAFLIVFILLLARRKEEERQQWRGIEPLDFEEGERYRRMLHRFLVSRPRRL